MRALTTRPYDFDDFIPEFFRRFARPSLQLAADVPADIRIDVTENDHDYQVRAEIPGAKKEDIRVTASSPHGTRQSARCSPPASRCSTSRPTRSATNARPSSPACCAGRWCPPAQRCRWAASSQCWPASTSTTPRSTASSYADRLGVVALAEAVDALAEKARLGDLELCEMEGSCFSVSNLGMLGGTGFTPIVNAPEVATVGIARAAHRVVAADGAFVSRRFLPLTLVYDHRVVDGVAGGEFMAFLRERLAQPESLLD